jgi:hypothetical protein
MYRQFNIQQFYVLPTECIYVFCVDLRREIISLNIINWLVFTAETECVDWAVRAEYLKKSSGFHLERATLPQHTLLLHVHAFCSADQSVRRHRSWTEPDRTTYPWREWDTKPVPKALSTSDVKVNKFMQETNIFTQKRISFGVL